jgi:3-hydroxyisobutyrate dehydrogenase
MAKIGFIGLGHMGLPMAINLVKAGHEVQGFDLQAKALAEFKEAGGFPIKGLSGFDKRGCMITMLQTGEQVKKVCIEKKLFQQMQAGALFIDCSSIDVPTTQFIQAEAKKLSLQIVDAPVSGGVAGASAASLTFMVGGEEEAFSEAKKILETMGKKVIHAGQGGSGQAAKICNNMILGVTMIAVSEAFLLADKLGLSAQKLHEVVSNSSGQCWVMNSYVPVPDVLPNVPANNQFKPGFTAAMMLKDLNLSQSSAKSVGLETSMAAKAALLYQHFVDKGHAEVDFSGIRLVD